MNTRKHSDGFVLTGVLALLVIASVIGGAFLFSARNSLRTAERWEGYDQCLLIAQSALEARNYNIWQNFSDYADETGLGIDTYDILETENGTVTAVVHEDGTITLSGEGLSGLSSTEGSGVLATVTVYTAVGQINKDRINNYADVTLTNIALVTYKGVTRKIQENVYYEYDSAAQAPGGASGGPRGVFDYIFFIDNDGYFSGVNANFNGDVRANENIELKYSSILLNGDAYAVGIVDTKKDYKNLNWSKYATQPYAGSARPAEYTDFNRRNTNYWSQGYTESSDYNEGVERMELPYIGPLSEYEDYAIGQGGEVRQGGAVLVDAVWGDDPGEDTGLATTLDDGSLVLDGTVTPFEIEGIVVAQGDVYIKGNYTGQGTIYAGRNIHIIGDVVALDAPSWPKPDANPYATADANKDKDFLGLCAKGSLVFGDYTAWSTHVDQKYLKTPYTKSHAVDATDAVNGYVKFYVDGVPHFDGDYTGQDGEFFDAVQTDGDPRLYYEATLGEVDFAALGVDAWVGHFDCVTYANHLFMGELDNNAVVNGSIVCRDEAVKRHGNLSLNWDIRLGSDSEDGSGFAPWLPGTLPRIAHVPCMVRWLELPLE